jgi:hypothetical protein
MYAAANRRVVQRMLETCRKDGGVLLVQPEHLLSFKLMGLQRRWTDKTSASGLGKQILNTYREFETSLGTLWTRVTRTSASSSS